MRIKCLHGFFIFEEDRAGQIADFMLTTGFDLSTFGRDYTFTDLADMENYSIITGLIGTFPAIHTFQGLGPWEVFEANGVVYDFTSGLIVSINTISTKAIVERAGNYFISPGLILPGSFTTTGSRVKNYSAWYLRESKRFLYSEVEYV